jgi:hypothetical protein
VTVSRLSLKCLAKTCDSKQVVTEMFGKGLSLKCLAKTCDSKQVVNDMSAEDL